MSYLKVQYVRNWPPLEFTLQTNKRQHVTRVTTQLSVQLAVWTGSGGGFMRKGEAGASCVAC